MVSDEKNSESEEPQPEGAVTETPEATVSPEETVTPEETGPTEVAEPPGAERVLDSAADRGAMGHNPEQEPMAIVSGKPLADKPKDLYIPPDALRVFLESFEGPLDLLLYLIRKQKLDILDLPILDITVQYMEYVELMKDLNLELAAEYLVMAAILAEIKSRLLLPKPELVEDEEDPRAALIARLKEYEIYKMASQGLDDMPRLEREHFTAQAKPADNCSPVILQPEVDLEQLMLSFNQVLKRARSFEHHHIQREQLSTRERMTMILEQIRGQDYVEFGALFDVSEGKAGVVVTFLAILELVKESLIGMIQVPPSGMIHVRVVG